MKRITIIALSISALTHSALGKRHHKDSQEMKTKWSSWKKNHTKTYDEYEEDNRNTIFVDNVNHVEEYNSNPNNTAKLEINHFADLTEEEFAAQYLGSAIDDSSNDDAEVEEEDEDETKRVLASLPSSIDWRTKGAVTSVKNQAHCGGCWAFSAIGALEGLHYIKTKKLQDFSEQQVLNCDTASSGCVRGFHDRAFTYTASKGVELESANPFKGSSSKCNYVASKATKINSGHVNVKPKSLSGLLTALASQPVAITLNGGVNAFRFYKSGVLSSGCASGTSHAVLAVGYTNVNGKQAIIVKNSWGTGWGQKGYLYISTASANSGNGVCGILTRPSYPTA